MQSGAISDRNFIRDLKPLPELDLEKHIREMKPVSERDLEKCVSILRPMTNLDLERSAIRIPHFIGVFMLDQLPRYPRRFETAIVNLDSSKGRGTHWVAYAKKNDTVYYFDSFGNLKPPKQLLRYFESIRSIEESIKKDIKYNYDSVQNFNTVICGHLCLQFLEKISEKLFPR